MLRISEPYPEHRTHIWEYEPYSELHKNRKKENT
jgi:hypothetical protein